MNFGWVPFWAQTMDHEWELQRAWTELPLASRPSACLGRNVFVTGLDDAVGYDLMRAGAPGLVEAAMFSTDYPHSATLWPRSRQHIEALTRGMRAGDRHKVLAGNAARVYGFDA